MSLFHELLLNARIVDLHVDADVSYVILDNGKVMTIRGVWVVSDQPLVIKEA